ncbi:MAG: nicotinate-nucleotide--dimethylbenzimidazole phosphoribosyltransferase [Thioalkalispiraceae bacterium]|jgi:nicotinate-nucleotide--dimethylbenzimidazole phosphoribosyltransferase
MKDQIEWLKQVISKPDDKMMEVARNHQLQLTKPPGSLGRLEELAITFAGMQQTNQPKLENIHIVVFAGDHGITEEQISAFPQAVTAQMVENFARGGAAISVLARELNAALSVVDVGVNAPASTTKKVINRRIVDGTANFAKHPAMSLDSLTRAFAVGRELAQQGIEQGMQLFIGGEMGIGNTTSATALAAALLEINVEDLAGPGSGLDTKGVSHKRFVIEEALYFHKDEAITLLDKLRCFAGVEIVCLVAAYICCAQNRVPVLVDGFIASVAALYARALNEGVRDWLLFSHRSHEPGHAQILKALRVKPILDLQMRLGEGSGAAVAVPIIRQALALHNNMATFAQAGVTGRVNDDNHS